MTCEHGEAVYWNQFNQVVQCHRCGQVFGPQDSAVLARAQRIEAVALLMLQEYEDMAPSGVEVTSLPWKDLRQALELAGGE